MGGKKIKKILLAQPNYTWITKRTWRFPPYTLCLLKSAVNYRAETLVFDPNFADLSEEDVESALKELKPDLVGVTSASTEYFDASRLLISIIRRSLPDAIIVFGGVIPTVLLEEAMKDRNVDYWMTGECDISFPMLVDELKKKEPDLAIIKGLAYWRKDGKAATNANTFIEKLDDITIPDYSCIIGRKNLGRVTLQEYGNVPLKYAPYLYAKKYPSAVTITTRGCPFNCVFCAGKTVSGQKVRFRSAGNVLAEIDWLYEQGIREVTFLDDHFLADKRRAMDIMEGILKRKYDMAWKCSSVTAWMLDREMLELMHKSGCDFLGVSAESGNQHTIDKIIKKPVNLKNLPAIFDIAKSIGFDIVVNFIIGFPGETWDQIRDTIKYAEDIDVHMVLIHTATPLPKTELMDICMREKLLPGDYCENMSKYSGYGKGLITTKEFTPFELEVIRSFEWDRINFSSEEKKRAIMRLNGITREELEAWRANTRRSLGISSRINNLMNASAAAEGERI